MKKGSSAAHRGHGARVEIDLHHAVKVEHVETRLPARRLTQGVQGVFAGAQSFARGVAENLAEYFSEETHTLAATPALESLTQERARALARLDQIAQRSAALQARLSRLAPRFGASV